MIDFAKAISSLCPGAIWTLKGNSYDGLEWFDESQSKPSQQELEMEYARLQAEYDAKEYQRKRQAEYPPLSDWADGMVKGDQEQIDKYIADCLAVKQKFPKGVK